ncbi:DUF6941 family protein [Leptospira levettii]|uniref:Uncharacterized protein n=1 Tax=Leptospira levettii TaxID=2023178 RepID=A0ABY2MTX2_9LEPT|nr:hypothetical protein [Leptospira levettii]TGL75423.1 hypothetical protein EHQ60_00430 [Leptospira levettii]
MSNPVVQAILFADRIIEEKNGKKGIIGTFDTIYSPSFPALAFPWGVYVAITGVTSKVQFSLSLKGKSPNPLIHLKGELNGTNAEALIELPLNFENIQFPEPGNYNFDIEIEGKLIGSRVMKLAIANIQNSQIGG